MLSAPMSDPNAACASGVITFPGVKTTLVINDTKMANGITRANIRRNLRINTGASPSLINLLILKITAVIIKGSAIIFRRLI
jgi:hypothetical protein